MFVMGLLRERPQLLASLRAPDDDEINSFGAIDPGLAQQPAHGEEQAPTQAEPPPSPASRNTSDRDWDMGTTERTESPHEKRKKLFQKDKGVAKRRELGEERHRLRSPIGRKVKCQAGVDDSSVDADISADQTRTDYQFEVRDRGVDDRDGEEDGNEKEHRGGPEIAPVVGAQLLAQPSQPSSAPLLDDPNKGVTPPIAVVRKRRTNTRTQAAKKKTSDLVTKTNVLIDFEAEKPLPDFSGTTRKRKTATGRRRVARD